MMNYMQLIYIYIEIYNYTAYASKRHIPFHTAKAGPAQRHGDGNIFIRYDSGVGKRGKASRKKKKVMRKVDQAFSAFSYSNLTLFYSHFILFIHYLTDPYLPICLRHTSGLSGVFTAHLKL